MDLETWHSNAPLFTVVTVALNDVNGVQATAASVMAQTFRSYEHVIVDGGSNDGTADWLKSDHGCLFSWSSEPDDGIFDAMNKGARRARGQIIVFLNSADTFAAADTLDRVARSWHRHNWRWAYGQLEYVGAEGTITGQSSELKYSHRRLAQGRAFAPHQATFMERELFWALGGFDLDFDFACDQELAMRAGKLSEPFVMPDVLARFLLGGAHSQSTYWRRELLYHGMRKKNRLLIARSRFLDYIYSLGMAAYREGREKAGKLTASTLKG